MTEITRNNFEDKYSEVVNKLKSAVFIAVDNEFTGLLSDLDLKPSLFDTGSERYDKLRLSIEQFVVMEVGITTFQFIEEKYKYVANRYTFYVYPRSFGSVDTKFMCQASSLEFLCQHNFDFNKFVYGGIPYLNRQQEAQLRKELYEDSLFRHLERTISIDDEKLVQSGCSRVAEWAASAVLGDELFLEYATYCKGEKRLCYIIHKELRQRFPSIWTFPDKGKIRVEKISQQQRKAFDENVHKDRHLEEDMMDSLLGFSRLFKLLVELRKPIVGHNLLLDLMIMYNQFHEQLPTQFTMFKQRIHTMFPVIYDTKFLSFELKKLVSREDLWESNVLSNLYYFFKNGRGRHIVLFSPAIELDVAGDVKFHEAGWDSFCTGFCFIRMAHIFAHVTVGSVMEGRQLSSKELLAAAISRKNCVNVIRASVSHVCLDGADPVSRRPNWLHVQTKGFRSIDVSKVAELFAKYGAVDVKPFSKYRALVAVGNYGSAKDILREFARHKEFRVSSYHPLWHSPMFNCLAWAGLVVSGSACAYFVYKELNKNIVNR